MKIETEKKGIDKNVCLCLGLVSGWRTNPHFSHE